MHTRHTPVGLLLVGLLVAAARAEEPALSDERVVFQTEHGDVEFGFYPEVAPVTAAHIFKLCVMGAYTGNHFFRVDKNFVAQVADVQYGRNLKMNEEQLQVARKTVPLEVKEGVKHLEGVVSMGRHDDPNSGGSSFSFLLGAAPHLDMQYTIFGRVTKGMEMLRELEKLPTRKEGIFVMPLARITIHSMYWYYASRPTEMGAPSSAAPGGSQGGAEEGGGAAGAGDDAHGTCEHRLARMRRRFHAQEAELQRVRLKCLPGH